MGSHSFFCVILPRNLLIERNLPVGEYCGRNRKERKKPIARLTSATPPTGKGFESISSIIRVKMANRSPTKIKKIPRRYNIGCLRPSGQIKFVLTLRKICPEGPFYLINLFNRLNECLDLFMHVEGQVIMPTGILAR